MDQELGVAELQQAQVPPWSLHSCHFTGKITDDKEVPYNAYKKLRQTTNDRPVYIFID